MKRSVGQMDQMSKTLEKKNPQTKTKEVGSVRSSSQMKKITL